MSTQHFAHAEAFGRVQGFVWGALATAPSLAHAAGLNAVSAIIDRALEDAARTGAWRDALTRVVREVSVLDSSAFGAAHEQSAGAVYAEVGLILELERIVADSAANLIDNSTRAEGENGPRSVGDEPSADSGGLFPPPPAPVIGDPRVLSDPREGTSNSQSSVSHPGIRRRGQPNGGGSVIQQVHEVRTRLAAQVRQPFDLKSQNLEALSESDAVLRRNRRNAGQRVDQLTQGSQQTHFAHVQERTVIDLHAAPSWLETENRHLGLGQQCSVEADLSTLRLRLVEVRLDLLDVTDRLEDLIPIRTVLPTNGLGSLLRGHPPTRQQICQECRRVRHGRIIPTRSPKVSA